MSVILEQEHMRASIEHTSNRHGGATQVEKNVNKDGLKLLVFVTK